jgi:N-acetylglucosamine-6-phosphate deacetylase
MKNEPIIFTGLNIYTEDKILPNAMLMAENGIIKNIGNFSYDKSQVKVLEFPPAWHLIPGMIDMHMHGAAGADTMDGTAESLAAISKALLQEGVTSFLPAVVSAPISNIEKALKIVAEYVINQAETEGAEILGINVEGQFLSAEKAGCQEVDYFINPDIDLFKKWQKLANNLIKIVTVAPELPNALAFIKYLHSQNIIASCGHSNASYEETNAAIKAGCTQCTHLFNAMREMQHRDPGIAAACLLSDQIMAEIIADGVHVHPAIIQLAYRLKGPDRIILVTDAIRAKYLAEGTYELGGQQVIVKNNTARLADGTLAGSVLKMNCALRNMIKFTGCSLLDAIKMTSANPAKQLNIFNRKGSIAIGKDADLVVLDEEFNVHYAIT